ncbi:cellulase family glycosylhydrolase [Mycobacterium sp. URHB0044]|uniref:cellulase family glycosylhydrolase n=1 Tax=Mycobacterium sp. URHB0044 TaxID=1380386 RepID=UPI000ABAF608|nr:cellulase family glycosylhydrolase [Mycobacterium sp. URHB0044]
MASAYASGIFISPPRVASYEYTPVAEIVVAPNTVGVAESPLYGASVAEINEQLDALQAIGVQNIRVFVPWGLVEPADNTYNWTYMDQLMSAAAARNMGVMAEVNATPNWAATDPSNPSFPPGSSTPNPAKFAEFMSAFTAHTTTVGGVNTSFASIVSAYEIWNEPNYVQFSNPIDPESYAALLAAVYPVIKAADPTANVVAGAVGATQTGPFTMDPVTFVQRMLDAGAGPFFDALSFHPYSDDIPFSGSCPTCQPNLLTPREQLDAIKAMVGLTKSIWISEYGVASTDAASYQQQAEWIKDLLDTWQNYSQAGPVFIYTGQDQAGSTDPGAQMGLWTDSGGQKWYTVGGVTYSVSGMLAAWIAAHPQVPTGPGDPGTPPVNPLTALFQAIAAQVQAFAAQVQAFLNTIVTAITNVFGGLGGPAAVAETTQTLALKIASVDSTEESSLSGDPEGTATDTEEAKATKGEGTTEGKATEVKATEEAATDGTATEETATDETTAEEAEPAVTEPVVTKPETTEPVVTKPVVTEPTVTEPVVTKPETTEPVVTKPETTKPETTEPVTTKPNGTEPAGTPSGTTPSAGSSTEPGKAGEHTKPGADAGKSGTTDGGTNTSKDRDREGGSGRHTQGTHGGASGTEVKGNPESVSSGATAAAEGASADGGTS